MAVVDDAPGRDEVLEQATGSPQDEAGNGNAAQSPNPESQHEDRAHDADISPENAAPHQNARAEDESQAPPTAKATEDETTEAEPSEAATSETEAADVSASPSAANEAAADSVGEAGDIDTDDEADEDEFVGEAEPIELVEELIEEEPIELKWFILKVASNRENSIADALRRRIKVEGLERYFGQIIVPTEDVAEFKGGKKRIVKRKLYPGYICVQMHVNDDTWFVVRDTPGIGDFTGAAGKPTPMLDHEVERILPKKEDEEAPDKVKSVIKFKMGDRVRIKEGTFENFEGEVEGIDEANGRVTVVINIFDRPTPVEIDHWQLESV